MNDLSQRTTFAHWKCSHYSLCCPLPKAKASVQQCPSTTGHCGVWGDAFIIHSGQGLLGAKHIQDVVEASFCHVVQYGLSLAGKDLTAVSFAVRTLSERKAKLGKPSAFFQPEVVRKWEHQHQRYKLSRGTKEEELVCLHFVFETSPKVFSSPVWNSRRSDYSK